MIAGDDSLLRPPARISRASTWTPFRHRHGVGYRAALKAQHTSTGFSHFSLPRGRFDQPSPGHGVASRSSSDLDGEATRPKVRAYDVRSAAKEEAESAARSS